MLSFLRDQNSEELPAEKKMKAAAAAAGKAAGSKKSAGSKKAADSKATDSKAADSKAADSKAADSKAADSKAADSKAADSKTSASKTAGINKVLRDDAINSQEPEFLTVSSHGKRVRKTTTLLVVLFIIGLICLVFMIKKSSPKTASASNSPSEDTLVETAIARLTGVKTQMFSRIDEIVGKFYEFSEVPQVKVNELAKNPFELETKTGNLKRGTENEMDARALWQQQLRQNSKGMQLWSIMQTNQGNRCMIDDEILGEGDSIRGFKVIQIGDNFVKLESDGVQIELTLSE